MKILVTACPSHGHLFLPVPLGWALRNAGHEVQLALPESMLAAGNQTGLPTARLTDVRMHDVMADTFAPLLERGIENASGPERGRYGVMAFSRLAERMADDIVELARAWAPDLILAGALEFAGPLAAAVTGTPFVAYGWGTWLTGPMATAMNDSLAELYGRYGVDPTTAQPQSRIDMCPPGLKEPEAPRFDPVRYVPYNGVGTTPSWVLEPTTTSRVCVTLGGSVGGGDNFSGGTPLLAEVLTALDGWDGEVVAALGGLDISDLGVLPDNVRVERWLPLSHVLPTCDLVIHHSGAGTCMTAASYAIPQLVLPQVGDGFRFADRLHALGAGLRLLPSETYSSIVRDAISTLMDEGEYREFARRLREEILAMPSPAETVPLLQNAARRSAPTA